MKGATAGLLAALGVRPAAGAQVSQAQCGNRRCANDPGICNDGCVCCVYANAQGRTTNSRCRPPGTCGPGTVACPAGQIFDPARGCFVPECLGDADCPQSPANSCRRRACSGGTCLATDEWLPDGTACGANGKCDEGRCFRAFPACFDDVAGGCTRFVVDAIRNPDPIQFCLGSRPGSLTACTATADCPAGEFCAASSNECSAGCPA